jgi:hypothetical protein
LQANYAYLYNQGVWIFGDWDKALRAAGFDPQRMRMRTFWDNKKITQELRRMRKTNLPLYPYYVMNNHQDLLSGALRQFGSWHKALMAAGLTSKKHVARKTRLGLLRELRDVERLEQAQNHHCPCPEAPFKRETELRDYTT